MTRAAPPAFSHYNGHKDWNYWNVALWLGNDEDLYRLARESYMAEGSAERAAADLLQVLAESGITATPDGAPYTVSSLTAAIAGMRSCWVSR